MMRVGLVGAGSIAYWHTRALRVAGFEVTAVSSRPGSIRVEQFASEHGIPKTYNGWKQMFDDRDDWDALVIATHTDGTPNVLSDALTLGVPLLVEKPVGWNAATLARLTARAHDRVIVGYNRRFYKPVERARLEARSGPPLLAHLSLPEAIVAEQGTEERYLEPLFENSCHGIDLARFVLGDLTVESVHHLRNEREQLCGMSAVLRTERNDILQFSANWDSPSNFALSLHRQGRRFELCPFEQASVYEGMDVIGPTQTYPIRRYVPRSVELINLDEIDFVEKPGFVAQAKALASLVSGNHAVADAATLEDAQRTLELCEALAGVAYRSSNE